ncbi:MAG: DUF92 domain-containing protein [Crenarchaeota archaeon]|nr:DUF92 domain-containing protein [Thermoproteota archaeon]MDW8033507.1 DUF92 domain-containing protein [Nitrososphaerota archaeon]
MTPDAIGKVATVVVLAVAMYFSRSLSFSGIIASTLIGLTAIFLGGWDCFLILLIFLTLGVAFTKYKHAEKTPGTLAQEKGGVRTWVNVFANGGPAIIPLVLEHFYNMEFFKVFFLSAVCSAASDTLSTEIGLLSKSKPRLITRLWKEVDKGVSGGVTLLGTIAGFLASLIIALMPLVTISTGISGLFFDFKDPLRLILTSTIAGFFGMIVDSLLGATVQALYVSKETGLLYEDPRKCNGECVLIRGFKHFDNNAVNFSSCLLAGIVGAILYML